jgi:hypothetical protein
MVMPVGVQSNQFPRALDLSTILRKKGMRVAIGIEKIHPLEGGFLRLKFRQSSRLEPPRVNPLIFYPKYFFAMIRNQFRWISLYLHLRLIYRKVKKDPKRLEYMDLALEPVTDNKTQTRELFQNETAQNYVHEIQRLKKIREGQTI